MCEGNSADHAGWLAIWMAEPGLLTTAVRLLGAVLSPKSSQVKSRDQPVSPPRAAAHWQLRELRVPLESPGDVGENALGTVPPLSCKVCTL